MIYTSYFAKLKKLPYNVVPIAICAKVPEWFKGKQYKKLAPTYDILMQYKSMPNIQLYTARYKSEVLSHLNPLETIIDIINLAEPKWEDENERLDIVLVCYEKSEDFCHRHLVAQWLNESGINCEEWK
jgi:hypothetical protein